MSGRLKEYTPEQFVDELSQGDDSKTNKLIARYDTEIVLDGKPTQATLTRVNGLLKRYGAPPLESTGKVR